MFNLNIRHLTDSVQYFLYFLRWGPGAELFVLCIMITKWGDCLQNTPLLSPTTWLCKLGVIQVNSLCRPPQRWLQMVQTYHNTTFHSAGWEWLNELLDLV